MKGTEMVARKKKKTVAQIMREIYNSRKRGETRAPAVVVEPADTPPVLGPDGKVVTDGR